MSWFDNIKEWTGKMVTEAIRVASGRKRWKGVVSSATQNVLTE